MDLDSNAYYKFCSPDRDDRYNEIIKEYTFYNINMIMKHQKCDAPIFVVHLEKFLKRIQKYFLRMDIFACMQSFMKMVKGFILAEI
jgi:hypothetical protein